VIFSHHGWPWDIDLVVKHPWLPSHLIFLLYGRNPDLPTMIHRESSEVVNLDDPKMWLRVRSQRVELFRRVMLVAFENLAIAQHKDTLRYAIIRGGGY
jgi:hypothetical protein